MGSEFASDGSASDRFFGSSSFCYLGLMLGSGLFGQQSAENFCFQLAGIFTGPVGSERDRWGGFLMQLKMFVLSGAAVALWLIPLTALDKRIGWHKSIQGVSLGAAIACAVSAGNIAQRLAEENEIETIKTRAITADVVDEIAVSSYVSQQQRQQEAEQILNGQADCSENFQKLERALALPCNQENTERSTCSEQSDQLAKNETSNETVQRIERVLQLRAQGWGKGKIILEVWGLTRGGGAKYKAAETEYHQAIGEEV
jgi:hypothetical protein